MPYGAFINALPPAFFLAVHLIGFLLGAFFVTEHPKAATGGHVKSGH